jgi:putative transposase
VSALAVLSTGEKVPNPKHLSRYQRRITRRQRELSRRCGPAKGRKPSKRWTAASARLARVHAKVARARADGLHKLTTRLAKSYPVVVVEDLNVAGMTASAKGSGHWRGKAGLNRTILDVAPGELRRQLGYKCSWYGSALVVADRWYPSSKTCSGCGWRKPSLPLSERMFRCDNTACGLVIDRDLNAALNLAALVRALVTGTASSGGNRPGDHLACAQGEERFTGSPGCSSVNCEDGAGRSRPGKTATVTRQRVAPEAALTGNDR